MTWKDLKLATLQKLFSAEGSTLVEDETTRDYIAAMPQTANEALQLICSDNICPRRSVTLEVTAHEGEFSPRYDMKKLTDDFYRPGTLEAYQVEGEAVRPVSGFGYVAQHYLVVPSDWAGTYEIWYDAWPKPFSTATEDGYVIPLDDDVAVILPLYMASQLYKDDDNGIATTYRNEFEAARDVLRKKNAGVYTDAWRSVTGWV